jgi:uncharacterized repeat protein (TIGR03803 family)
MARRRARLDTNAITRNRFGRTITSAFFMLVAPSAFFGQGPTFTVLYTFTGGESGSVPRGVIENKAGNFFGTTDAGGPNCSLRFDNCGGVFQLTGAGAESFLHVFTNPSGGLNPNGGVIQDTKGNLYGVTSGGGNSSNSGVVYKVDPSGKETVLHVFDHTSNLGEGWEPLGNLVGDAAGNLYGATTFGGVLNCADGCGVVFRIDATGAYTVLHSFSGAPADGQAPDGTLVLDATGNLYGTTFYGGSATGINYGQGAGTVFKLDPNGTETILYNFNGITDGGSPTSGLKEDRSGNFYGTAQDEGEAGGVSNNGVLFKLDPAGDFTLLYSFTGRADGGGPVGPLVLDEASGDVYGTAAYGGLDLPTCHSPWGSGCGVVFKVDPSSETETVLYSFTGLADGDDPATGLIARKAPNSGGYQLFGTTYLGGDDSACSSEGCGVVFQLTFSK